MKKVGIDLGTTNTVMAIGGTVVTLDPNGTTILPSVVAYPPTGTTLVGAGARRRRPIDPRNTVFSSKRLIGRRWDSEDTGRFRDRYPLELVDDGEGMAGFATRVGTVSPIEVGATILADACERASIDPSSTSAVIAVPAVFSKAARAATVEAGTRAGFAEVGLIEEPHASVLAYMHQARRQVKYVAAYDFGGGTFDVAIMDCSTVPFRVLGYSGDLYLGGDEIDAALAEWAAAEVLRSDRWDLRSRDDVYARLIGECERAKIRLAGGGDTVIDLTQVDIAFPGAGKGVVVPADRLIELGADLVRRTFVLCDEALAASGVGVDAIEEVVLAGGTTLLPMIRSGVEAYFGSVPLSHLDPMEVVSIGASLAPL